MNQGLAYQMGAVFAIVAALMILSLMRDWIPAELRKAARYAVSGLVLAATAVYRAIPAVRWPSFGGAQEPAASSLVREPIPQVKTAPKSSRPGPKIREISPEEAERLREQIRNRKEIPIGR